MFLLTMIVRDGNYIIILFVSVVVDLAWFAVCYAMGTLLYRPDALFFAQKNCITLLKKLITDSCSDGWGMYYTWKITEYQSKQCTGKQTITPSENQEDQGRTGSILYAKT